MENQMNNVAAYLPSKVEDGLESQSSKDDAINQKLLALRNEFISHPDVTQVLEALESLRRYGNMGGELGRAARCLLLSGPSGSGKTTLLLKWAAQFPTESTHSGDVRPVLYVKVPSNCTTKSLAETMLLALGLTGNLISRGTEIALLERVKHHLRNQGVKVVILDEMQGLLKSENPRVIFRVADVIKEMLNEAICPFVLAGMPELTAIFDVNEQLMRRATGQYSLRAFKWEDADDRSRFRAILAAYDERLPLQEPSGLGKDKALAFRIHCFSGGKVGRAIDFLYAATTKALEKDAPRLSMELLYDTAKNFPGANKYGRVNPFGAVDLESLKCQPNEDDNAPSRTTRLRRGKRQLKQADVLAA